MRGKSKPSHESQSQRRLRVLSASRWSAVECVHGCGENQNLPTKSQSQRRLRVFGASRWSAVECVHGCGKIKIFPRKSKPTTFAGVRRLPLVGGRVCTRMRGKSKPSMKVEINDVCGCSAPPVGRQSSVYTDAGKIKTFHESRNQRRLRVLGTSRWSAQKTSLERRPSASPPASVQAHCSMRICSGPRSSTPSLGNWHVPRVCISPERRHPPK